MLKKNPIAWKTVIATKFNLFTEYLMRDVARTKKDSSVALLKKTKHRQRLTSELNILPCSL